MAGADIHATARNEGGCRHVTGLSSDSMMNTANSGSVICPCPAGHGQAHGVGPWEGRVEGRGEGQNEDWSEGRGVPRDPGRGDAAIHVTTAP